MADPSALDFLRIPSGVFVALDWRPYRFALQPYHYITRITHVVSMAAFFGGIAALDLRLIGWRPALPLDAFGEHILPWLYATFGVAFLSGVMLFFYDPVHVGSHAYFTLKLLMMFAAVANAAFSRGVHATAQCVGSIPKSYGAHSSIAGTVSLLLWTGVVICACLNVEGPPKVLLR